MDLVQGDVVLCKFFFSDLLASKNRPVLVFKDNLPFNDFIAVPISSKIHKFHHDEIEIGPDNFLTGGIPKRSKLILRKTFVVSKSVIVKKYGSLNTESFQNLKKAFCSYFNCQEFYQTDKK